MRAAEPAGGAGPWWVASYEAGGRRQVIRFKLDGEDYYPVSIEMLDSIGWIAVASSRARRAALDFVARWEKLIAEAFEIAGEIDKARAFAAAQGYAEAAG